MQCAALAAFLERHQSRLAETGSDEWDGLSALIATLKAYGEAEVATLPLPKPKKKPAKTAAPKATPSAIVRGFAEDFRATRGDFEAGMQLLAKATDQLKAPEVKALAAALNLGTITGKPKGLAAIQGWIVSESNLRRLATAADIMAE